MKQKENETRHFWQRKGCITRKSYKSKGAFGKPWKFSTFGSCGAQSQMSDKAKD